MYNRYEELIDAAACPIEDILYRQGYNFKIQHSPRNFSEVKTTPLYGSNGKRMKMFIPIPQEPGKPVNRKIKLCPLEDPKRGIVWMPTGVYYENKYLSDLLFLKQLEDALALCRIDMLPSAKGPRVLTKLSPNKVLVSHD